MAIANIYEAANHFCKPYEIFIILDGDDEIVGKQVFKLFNAIYQAQGMWVVYTNFMTERGSVGYSRQYSDRVKENHSYRQSGFMISHLRSFYTKLFSYIKDEDLKDDNGDWVKAGNDVAMYIPIMEMSGKKVNYIPELTYLYNPNTGLNNHKIRIKEQKGNDRNVRKKQRYTPLPSLFTPEEEQELKMAMGRKIPIRDPNLPRNESLELEGWEKP